MNLMTSCLWSQEAYSVTVVVSNVINETRCKEKTYYLIKSDCITFSSLCGSVNIFVVFVYLTTQNHSHKGKLGTPKAFSAVIGMEDFNDSASFVVMFTSIFIQQRAFSDQTYLKFFVVVFIKILSTV